MRHRLSALLRRSTDPSPAESAASTSFVSTPNLAVERGGTVDALRAMEAATVDRFALALWEALGWETEPIEPLGDDDPTGVARTGGSDDRSALLVTAPYGEHATLDAETVRRISSVAEVSVEIDEPILLTTGHVPGRSRRLADELGVTILDAQALADLIADAELVELLASYAPVTIDDGPTCEGPDAARSRRRSENSIVHARFDRRHDVADDDARSVPDRWHRLILASVGGWIALVVGVNVLSDPAPALVFLAAWPALPLAIYMDAAAVSERVTWPENAWLYVVPSLVGIFAIVPGAVYLYRRRRRLRERERDRGMDGNSIGGSSRRPPGERSRSNATTGNPGHPPTIASSTGIAEREDPPTIASSSRAITKREEPSSGRVVHGERGPTVRTIEYEGRLYRCAVARSPNDRWRLAVGRPLESGDPRPLDADGSRSRSSDGGRYRHRDRSPERVFVHEDGEFHRTVPVEAVENGAIANSGDAVLVARAGGSGESTHLHVDVADGEENFRRTVAAIVGPCAISADGRYVAASTFAPDRRTVVYDVDRGERTANHENRLGNVQSLEFVTRDGGWHLRLGDGADPRYVIATNGRVVRKHDRARWEERLASLRNDGDIDELRGVLRELWLLYEEAERPRERRRLANAQADTHLRLASLLADRSTERAVVQRHLRRATARYYEVLPWPAGKRGAASALHAAASERLDAGEYDGAIARLEAIRRLESGYDETLLPSDARRIDDVVD